MKNYLLIVLVAWLGVATANTADERPNFLFIIAEDMSPNLGCYGDPDALTPNLDALAARSIRYTRAFSATGVCATSRSAMITGMHPSSIGTQHMRSKIVLPDNIRPFPALLRGAGYFCTNRGKEDYNFDTRPDVWDAKQWKAADWANRGEGQPFFAIYGFPDTHESRLWEGSKTKLVDQSKLTDAQRHDPDKVTVPKWLPGNDDAVKREWSRYQDLVTLMDDQYIGPLLRHLENTGVADDTIVFFLSDHGAPFPRAKQWSNEAGTRVPLLIHFPEKWQHLAGVAPGETSDRLVSLIDLGPTVLSLAGLEPPSYLDGRAFLGPAAAPPRKNLVFTRDRMDERADFIRVLRDQRYRYTRNFLPQVPAFPWLTYMEKLQSSKAFRGLQSAGNAGRFSGFLAASKPAEELYDLEIDPDEFTNLASDPAHQQTLERLRGELADWMLKTRDSGFLPEQQLMVAEKNAGSIRKFCADEKRYPLSQLIAGELSLDDKNAAVRFHAALRSSDEAALREQLASEADSDVRVALAWSLKDVEALSEVIESENEWSRVLALNALDYLGAATKSARPLLQSLATQEETKENLYDRWLSRRILTHAAVVAPGHEKDPTSDTTAGLARVDITPRVPVRMVGYASRDYEGEPSENKLFARALAIGNGDGELGALMITADLLGIPKSLRERVFTRLEKRLGITAEQFAISATHTHGGPSLSDYMQEMHFCKILPPSEKARIDEYTDWLVDQLERVANEAAESLQPANLRWGEGSAGFAMNRRTIVNGKWKSMRPNPGGSVDHSVPVLTVTAADDEQKVLGVFLSYACHCTSYAPPNKGFHGDWAGAAAGTIEARHPDSVALVAAGCGADANPDPRIADAGPFIEKHGVELADQVDALLAEPDRTFQLTAVPDCQMRTVQLPLAFHLDRKQFQQWVDGKDKRRAFYGQVWLDRIDRGEPVPKEIDYLVQTWRFAGENDRSLTSVFLPGEVVSGYSLRIKDELNTDQRRNWVIGYANESPCYITTAKQIAEGGYEVLQSMVSYDKPSRLAPETEDIIVEAVVDLAGGKPAAAEKVTPRVRPNEEPLTPDEALASMHVRSGLKVELVASEPLVMDPVAFDWGPDGRLWVVEMRDYPNGLTWNGLDDPLNVPGGRVKVLTDTDGDGRYDKAEVFLDKLSYPSGIKVWDKGVLITAAPNIIYAEDTTGDGKADLQENWYQGFAKSNQQHRVNGLAWGLDNWLHVANGDGGGVILSRTTRDEVDIRGHDLRIDPFTGEHQPLSGRTQCGRYRDDWGNWFGCNNSNPLWHFPMRYSQLKRNSAVSPPSASVDVPVEPGAAPVYPRSTTLERFNQPDRANRFTSVCGPAIYRDDYLGSAFTGNAFVCEPVHNLVSRQVLRASGATFTSDRAPDEKQSEFFASNDTWSRPVSVRTGPDGALWVADMYRLVIEHPEWIPVEWQEKYDLRAGSDRGRIYRIFPAAKKPGAIPDLTNLSNAELVAQLESPNGSTRDLVHQMLLWREADDVVPALKEMVEIGQRPTARLHALSVLDWFGQIDTDLALLAIGDEHPGVVRNAIRISAAYLNAGWYSHAARMANDAFVAQEMVGVLGEFSGFKTANTSLVGLLLRHRNEPYVSATAFSSVSPENLTDIVDLLCLAYTDGDSYKRRLMDFPGVQAPSNAQIEKFASMASLWKVDPATQTLVDAVIARTEVTKPVAMPWQISILIGLLEKGASIDSLSADSGKREILNQLAASSRAIAGNDELPEWQRLEAIRLIRCKAVFDPVSDVDQFAAWISPRSSSRIREAAFGALGRSGHAEVAGKLIERWPSLSPNGRRSAMQLLLSRGAWTADLLTAMEEKTIPVAQIDAASRQQLMKSGDPAIQKRSKELFSTASSSNRAQVLEMHADVLRMDADPAAGKIAFATACIACHALDGVGNAIGPDLAALTDRSPDSMLVAILDPNRAVEDKYMNYTVTTNEGAQFFGLISGENASAVTLRAADGSEQQLLRADIASMTSAGISLMPDGLEATLTKPQLADLIAYLGSFGSAAAAVEPPLSARVRPGGKGIIELRASKCRFSGDRIEYMPDYDALGWWTSDKDRAEWTIVLDRPGKYRVEWDYSVSPEAAGNGWQLLISGEFALEGKVASSGSWETFQVAKLGEVALTGGDNKIVVRSKGKVAQALFDLRAIRFVPVGE